MGMCNLCNSQDVERKKFPAGEYMVCGNGHIIGKVLARTIKNGDGRTQVYWIDTKELM